jgi:hypothetical protein
MENAHEKWGLIYIFLSLHQCTGQTGGKKFFGMVHEIGLTDSCVILIDVGGPADGAAFIVTSRH